MANPHKGEVAIEAAGKTYVLCFTIDALCSVESVTGLSLGQIQQAIMDPAKRSLTIMRALMWGALREKHPEMSLREAGELIPRLKGDVLFGRLGEAMQRAFPESEAGDGDPQQPGGQMNGTGPASTALGVN